MCQTRLYQFDPVAQPRAGFARMDKVMNRESFGFAEG